MSGRSIGILGLSVGCGLVAMYGASQLIGGKEKPVEMRDVLVAARDLRAEEIFKPELIQSVRKPINEIPAGAISDPKGLEGRWVEIPMLSGEVIIEGKLAAKDAVPGLPGRIPDGMRAFSIEVTEESGVAGFVLPGYHVDILQEVHVEASTTRRTPPARLVLQNVLVLAAGQVVTRGEDKSINVRTVTLAVEPEQAQTLVAARIKGPLSLALRGLDDAGVIEHHEPEPEPEETPVVQVAAPTPMPPLPPPVPRPRPVLTRRTTIIHGLQHPVTVHHRQPLVPAGPARGPAVATATPGVGDTMSPVPETTATP